MQWNWIKRLRKPLKCLLLVEVTVFVVRWIDGLWIEVICFLLLSANYSTSLFRQRLCSRLTASWRYINFILLSLLLTSVPELFETPKRTEKHRFNLLMQSDAEEAIVTRLSKCTGLILIS